MFLRCKVRGDEAKAWELAKNITRDVIDALRFVVATSSGHDPRVGHVAASYDGGGVSMWILFDDGVQPQLHSMLGRGPHVMFRLDRSLITSMAKAGVWSVFDLLVPTPTEFQEALLRAVRWLSKALIADDDSDSLLSTIVALESIFTRSKGEPILRDLSEGCAFLLGENVEERMRIKKSVSHAYAMRSSLSHGESQSTSRSEANEAIAFAKSVILKLLIRQHEFESLDDMNRMIECQKFGGS